MTPAAPRTAVSPQSRDPAWPDPDVLKLNPDATIATRRVGRAGHRIIIVDDFYQDPERLRDLADHAIFSRDPSIVLDFPGERAQIPADTRHLVAAVCALYGKRDKPVHECILISLSAQVDGLALSPSQRQPHTDPTVTALVYLNRPEECAGGTGFYRHRPTGTEWIPHRPDRAIARLMLELNYDLTDLTKPGAYEAIVRRIFFDPDFAARGNETINDGNTFWELMDLVEMRFNRLLIYDGRIPHSMYAKPGDFAGTRRLYQLLSVSPDTS